MKAYVIAIEMALLWFRRTVQKTILAAVLNGKLMMNLP